MADLNSVGKVSIEPNSIQLPECIEVLGNLEKGKRFAIDIGTELRIFCSQFLLVS